MSVMTRLTIVTHNEHLSIITAPENLPKNASLLAAMDAPPNRTVR